VVKRRSSGGYVATETRAVFDTNVLVRALVHRAEDARVWMADAATERVHVLVPDLIYAESASALTRYARTGKLAIERVLALLATIVELPFEPTPSQLLTVPACALAFRHGITTYDAHYVALAEAEDAVLVTADRRLAEVASRSILLD
jgi:predicted nucleic acid-binding protein